MLNLVFAVYNSRLVVLCFCFVVFADILAGGKVPESEVLRWWNQAEPYMKDDVGKLSQTERRRIAGPLLLSAWQNHQVVQNGNTRRNIGLRLLQAQIGNASLIEAYKTLSEIDKSPDFQFCKRDSGATVLEQYSCAELSRLASSLHYTWYSQANTEVLGRRTAKCAVLFDPVRSGVPSCLQFASSEAETSVRRFGRILDGLTRAEPDHLSICDAILPVAKCAKDEVIRQIKARLYNTRINLALSLQEQGTGQLPEAIRVLRNLVDSADVSALIRDTASFNLSRTLLDVGDEASRREASAILASLRNSLGKLQVPSPPQRDLQSRVELASARLLFQAQQRDVPAILAALERAINLRELVLQESLQQTGVFDFENRLTEFANFDDVLLSILLAFDSNQSKTLLARYAAGFLGAGDRALKDIIRSIRQAGRAQLQSNLAEAVASESEDWAFGSLINERRERSFESLRKELSGWQRPKLSYMTSVQAWQAFWSKPQSIPFELAVVLQYRPYRLDQPTHSALKPPEFVLLHFIKSASAPRIVRLGSSTGFIAALDSLHNAVERSGQWQSWAKKISSAMEWPASPANSVPRRLYLLAMGQSQRIPWPLLFDGQMKQTLLDQYSFVQLDSLKDVGVSQIIPPSGQSLFAGLPATAGLANIVGTRALGQLAKRQWTPAEVTAVQRSLQSLGNVVPGFKDLQGNQADEASLKQAVGPKVLYLFAHGTVLRTSAGLVASDQGNALFAPAPGEDGILLASELRHFRLDGTRLVLMGICKSSSGGGGPRSGSLEGLRYSAHVAGASTVVAPVWNAETLGTADLFREFLDYSRKQDLDFALRQAQIDARLRKRDPKGWAGWILSGSPSLVP